MDSFFSLPSLKILLQSSGSSNTLNLGLDPIINNQSEGEQPYEEIIDKERVNSGSMSAFCVIS